MYATVKPEPADTEVWTRTDVAAFLRIAVRTLSTRIAAGQIPPATRVGDQPRWHAAEIRAWFVAGCPTAVEWAAIKPTRFRDEESQKSYRP